MCENFDKYVNVSSMTIGISTLCLIFKLDETLLDLSPDEENQLHNVIYVEKTLNLSLIIFQNFIAVIFRPPLFMLVNAPYPNFFVPSLATRGTLDSDLPVPKDSSQLCLPDFILRGAK